MTDAEFLAALEACTLPEECFHHRDHVRAAFLYLKQGNPATAIARFSESLKRFATSLGKTNLYHETITWAYLLLIHERMARSEDVRDFEAFAERNADLFAWRPSVLDRYYREETLRSELARRVFVLPDRLSEAK